MAPRSVRFGVRSWKLSKVGQVIGWVTKNLLSRAPRASEGTLSQSRRNLQSLAPTNPHWACVVGYGLFSLGVACAPAVGTLMGR
jgi:hypothetical protein